MVVLPLLVQKNPQFQGQNGYKNTQYCIYDIPTNLVPNHFPLPMFLNWYTTFFFSVLTDFGREREAKTLYTHRFLPIKPKSPGPIKITDLLVRYTNHRFTLFLFKILWVVSTDWEWVTSNLSQYEAVLCVRWVCSMLQREFCTKAAARLEVELCT